MSLLILGLVLFIGMHLVSTMTARRAALIGRLGEGGYKIVYSLVSALGLFLIVYGYARAPYLPIWDPPVWARHATFLLMLPVFPLLIASQLPGRIKTVIAHPMLLAVKLWAIAHLLTKGTAAAMLMYAALLAWAIYDLISVKQRERAGLVTIKTGPLRNDVIAVLLGLAIYLVMINFGHWKLIGTPILPANVPVWLPRWLGG
jgi:uncharacterized membrane protein